mmetsp:Transcript_45218/g.72833  ORF Transcript_45218/g.72833 Transcript_45218/m.72833 type:complete len:220 (-) Transcript_45218:137-796(-)|eukprot:CAMPEP_0179408866 /NCGR_PEP_ID=MMETSP0799-20121207/2351_1 /TAXON_ID=46947 /ORGANISM="Geminigera cryophila, Strain CCMP2564" /LENGTH=219 /DNA_ID=CAMNT_0021180415 /DNA_START=29 /DNA_END=688 /DNA_ORIENTATION=-
MSASSLSASFVHRIEGASSHPEQRRPGGGPITVELCALPRAHLEIAAPATAEENWVVIPSEFQLAYRFSDAATAPTEPQTPSPGDEHAPATSDEEASVRRGEGQPADMDCRTLQRIPAFLVLPPDFENTCSCELLAYEEMPRELDIRLEIVSPLCPWKPSCCAVAVLMVGGILILFFSTWLGRWIGGDFGDPRCVNRDDGPCAVGIQNGTEVRRWSMGS